MAPCGHVLMFWMAIWMESAPLQKSDMIAMINLRLFGCFIIIIPTAAINWRFEAWTFSVSLKYYRVNNIPITMEIACRKFRPIEFGRFGSGRFGWRRLESLVPLRRHTLAHMDIAALSNARQDCFRLIFSIKYRCVLTLNVINYSHPSNWNLSIKPPLFLHIALHRHQYHRPNPERTRSSFGGDLIRHVRVCVLVCLGVCVSVCLWPCAWIQLIRDISKPI